MNTHPLRKRFARSLSLFLTALLMAIVVWAVAINATDPMEKRIYPNSLTMEIVGLDEKLFLTNFNQPDVQLILTASRSAWATLTNNPGLIHVFIDLTGLKAGQAEIPVKTRVELPAVRVDDAVPRTLKIQLTANTS
jgi:hypothetical protein